MTEAEIVAILESDEHFEHDVTHPAFDSFVLQMRRFDYAGPFVADRVRTSWTWFSLGWDLSPMITRCE